ncbi:MAG: secretin N-terminal domain-containing protein [Planctomycetaceae bacterium]
MANQLAALIRALDSPAQQQGQSVLAVPIRRADPVKLKQAIEAYRGGYRSRQTQHKSTGEEESRPSMPAPDGPQSARQTHNDIELVMFQEPAADQPQPAEPQPEQTQPPGEENRDELQRRLRELGPDVEIETLPDLDVIIIRGRNRDVEEVRRIIQEIERLSAETVPAIEVYMLKHVGGEAVAELVTRIQDDLVGGQQGRVSVTALVKPNALLLIGWGEAVKAMKELLDKLDQPVAPETQLRVFRLRHAPAATASLTVQQFFAQRTGLGPKVHVNSDARSNSLIVQASPRDMQEVALLLEKLDTGHSQSVNQVRIFKLTNSLAVELANTLQDAIDAARGRQGTGAGAAAGTGTGQGAGQGTSKSAALELLTIDTEGEKVFKSGILSDVRITPDPQRNSLIVTAPAESMELLAALIRQMDETPAAVAQIKVFRIVNGDAQSLIQMLRSLLPAQTGANVGPSLPGTADETSLAPLRFSVEVRTNSIIATGSAGDLRIIEALLLRLDEKEIQQRRNTVYRLKNAPALDVAKAINDFLRSERTVQQAAPGSLNPFQQIEAEVVVVPEPVSNALIISATPRFFDEILKLVEKLDEQPPQVMIQVLIAEVALNDTDEFGIELGLQDSLLFDRSLLGDLLSTTNTVQSSTPAGILTDTQQVIQSASNTPGFLFNNTPVPDLPNSGSAKSLATSNSAAGQAISNFAVNRMNSELGFGGLVLSASSESVSVLIRALQESRRMEILSRPQIMTLDNQPAFIQVGERVPRIVASNITETGGQVNTIELTNVGILLGVTPRISPDGTVVMDIDAEKSEVGPDVEGIPVTVAPEGTIIRSPRINVTQAQTTISAPSGQTVVLAGLITKGTNELHRKVPWLSDIPLLGRLFRFNSIIARRTELLIIMTPHVVRNPEDADRIKQQESARMHWCCCDVHAVHGDGGLCHDINCPTCNAAVPVIYPDLNPQGAPLTPTPESHDGEAFPDEAPKMIVPKREAPPEPKQLQKLGRMLTSPQLRRTGDRLPPGDSLPLQQAAGDAATAPWVADDRSRPTGSGISTAGYSEVRNLKHGSNDQQPGRLFDTRVDVSVGRPPARELQVGNLPSDGSIGRAGDSESLLRREPDRRPGNEDIEWLPQ